MSNDSLVGDFDIILCGDIDARVGELLDYETVDVNIPELAEYNHLLSDNELPPRCSCDKVGNTCGRELVNCMKLHSMSFVNGGIGDEKGIGDYTFILIVGCRVIDYFVCT